MNWSHCVTIKYLKWCQAHSKPSINVSGFYFGAIGAVNLNSVYLHSGQNRVRGVPIPSLWLYFLNAKRHPVRVRASLEGPESLWPGAAGAAERSGQEGKVQVAPTQVQWESTAVRPLPGKTPEKRHPGSECPGIFVISSYPK